MDDQRRWEDLNVDCLGNIFGRVGMESLLLDVPFVCKSWYTATLNPSCWERLIFPELETDPDGFDLQTNHHFWSYTNDLFGTFMTRFGHKYQIDESRFSVTAFIKFVVNRSGGHTNFLRLPECCTEEALEYVADVCPDLKALSLPRYLAYLKASKIPELIGKWKDLELLALGSSIEMEKYLSQISIHCKNFCALHVYNSSIGKDEALTIVNLVPNIKYLRLRWANIEREGLFILLRGCKDLVVLDVRDCRGFKEGDDQISKLAVHITNFRCEGSRSFHSDFDD